MPIRAPAEYVVPPGEVTGATAGLSVESAATPATTTPGTKGTPGTKTRKVEPEAVAAAAEPELTREGVKKFEEYTKSLGEVRREGGTEYAKHYPQAHRAAREELEEEYSTGSARLPLPVTQVGVTEAFTQSLPLPGTLPAGETSLGRALPPLGAPRSIEARRHAGASVPIDVVSGSVKRRLFAGSGEQPLPEMKVSRSDPEAAWLDTNWANEDFGKLAETFDWVSVPLALKYRAEVDARLNELYPQVYSGGGTASKSTPQLHAAQEWGYKEVERLRRNAAEVEQFLLHTRAAANRYGLGSDYAKMEPIQSLDTAVSVPREEPAQEEEIEEAPKEAGLEEKRPSMRPIQSYTSTTKPPRYFYPPENPKEPES